MGFLLINSHQRAMTCDGRERTTFNARRTHDSLGGGGSAVVVWSARSFGGAGVR